jgi:hypothetical protein
MIFSILNEIYKVIDFYAVLCKLELHLDSIRSIFNMVRGSGAEYMIYEARIAPQKKITNNFHVFNNFSFWGLEASFVSFMSFLKVLEEM